MPGLAEVTQGKGAERAAVRGDAAPDIALPGGDVAVGVGEADQAAVGVVTIGRAPRFGVDQRGAVAVGVVFIPRGATMRELTPLPRVCGVT